MRTLPSVAQPPMTVVTVSTSLMKEEDTSDSLPSRVLRATTRVRQIRQGFATTA